MPIKPFPKIKPHSFFLATGLLFGLLYFLVVPPFQSPDEFNHFYRAYQVSEAKVLPERLSNRLGGTLPASIDQFYSTFRFGHVTPDFRYNLYHLTETFDIKIRPEERKFDDFANTSNYSPLSYLPQATVIAVLRRFDVSLGVIYYAGRWVTFLVWLLVVFYCIKRVPIYKWLLVVISLLPTNLFIANSFSADNVTNMLALLWITQIFRITFGEGALNRRGLIVLALLAVLLPLAKLVYAGLILLIFIIPRHKFVSSLSRVMTYLLVILPAAFVSFIWAGLVAQNHISFDAYDPLYRGAATLSPGSDFQAQLHLILDHPAYFLSVLWKTIFQAAPFYLPTYIGAFGTHLYYQLPDWMWLSAYGIIFYAALLTEKQNRFSLPQRLLLAAAFFLAFILLVLTIHLYWDRPGSAYVEMLQGRYLIPLFPLLFMLTSDFFRINKSLPKWPLMLSIFILNSLSIHLLFHLYFAEPGTLLIEAHSDLEKSESGYFSSTQSGIYFADQQNKTTLEKRSGQHAALCAPKSPYGLSFKFNDVRDKDILEFEIWRKGEGGVAVLTGSDSLPFLFQQISAEYGDSKGWKKLRLWYQHSGTDKSTQADFYVYNLGTDSVYFDDLVIRHKRLSAGN